MRIFRSVALARHVHLNLGGPVRRMALARGIDDVRRSLVRARKRSRPVFVLVGGIARLLWCLADEIRGAVRRRFGVRLELEPEAVDSSRSRNDEADPQMETRRSNRREQRQRGRVPTR